MRKMNGRHLRTASQGKDTLHYVIQLGLKRLLGRTTTSVLVLFEQSLDV